MVAPFQCDHCDTTDTALGRYNARDNMVPALQRVGGK